jgi:hypothetical protein
MERSGVKCFHCTHVFDLTNLKGEKKRNVGKLNNELNIVMINLSISIYRESRSGVNIAKRNISTGLFGLRKWMNSTLFLEHPEFLSMPIFFNAIILQEKCYDISHNI